MRGVTYDSRPEVPSAVPKPTKPECPRCRMPLGNSRYEGLAVLFCDQCWGYFVGLREFEKILQKRDENFSKQETRSTQRARAHSEDGKILRCVTCTAPMAKLKLEDQFFIDFCRNHGVWLDTGEIKRAQILDEKINGCVRAALRKALEDDDEDDE